jgi:hypothetical protein
MAGQPVARGTVPAAVRGARGGVTSPPATAMPEPSLFSLLMLGAGVLALLAAGVAWWLGRRGARPKPLPAEWALAARPVFNADERRLHRLLREALPQQVILAKLPLVRFCQPTESSDVRYWFDLLGAAYVGFAICSASGRVLAAVDLDDRGSSRRSQQIKQAVLGACHIRYLRCSPDELPTLAELRLLVPHVASAERTTAAAAGGAFGSATVSGLPEDADLASAPTRPRRARRPVLWQDSGFLNDSFFGAEYRAEASYPGAHGPLASSAPLPPGRRWAERSNGQHRGGPHDPPDDRAADERYGAPSYADPYEARPAPPQRASRPMPLDHGLWPGEADDYADVQRFDAERSGGRGSRRAPLRDPTRPGEAGGW